MSPQPASPLSPAQHAAADRARTDPIFSQSLFSQSQRAVRTGTDRDAHLETTFLTGARVAVVGQGDTLGRVLTWLHRFGAMCVVLDDAYHAACELSHRPEGYSAVVLVLPCCYAEELSVLRAIRTYAPRVRTYVTGVEQNSALFDLAVRHGAAGVLTGEGIMALAGSPADARPAPEPAPASVARPHAVPTMPQGPLLTGDEFYEDSESSSATDRTDDAYEVPAMAGLEPLATSDDAESEALLADDEAHLSPLMPVEPLLTAEELHALLYEHHETQPLDPRPVGTGGSRMSTNGAGGVGGRTRR